MKSIFFSLCALVLMKSSAHASCQWSYLNQLNKDIKHAQDLLSEYSICRIDCTGLETGLIASLAKMNTKSSCGSNIFTTANVETIDFIGGRFKLIQKQKTASTWAFINKSKPTLVSITKPNLIVKPTFSKRIHKSAPPVKFASLPKSVKKTVNSKARIAYEKSKQQQIKHDSKRRELAHQRLDKQLKQIIIQEEKVKLVNKKRRAIQHHLHKQRLLKQQFLKKRALAIQVNKQRVRQQRLARLQRINRR